MRLIITIHLPDMPEGDKHLDDMSIPDPDEERAEALRDLFAHIAHQAECGQVEEGGRYTLRYGRGEASWGVAGP